jgi:hypothetical protein
VGLELEGVSKGEVMPGDVVESDPMRPTFNPDAAQCVAATCHCPASGSLGLCGWHNDFHLKGKGFGLKEGADSAVVAHLREAWAASSAPATPAANTTGDSRWNNAILSGLFVGIVMAGSRRAAWLLPTGAAYGFCIINPNFGFSRDQRAVATGIALAIGTWGNEIVRAVLQWMR